MNDLLWHPHFDMLVNDLFTQNRSLDLLIFGKMLNQISKSNITAAGKALLEFSTAKAFCKTPMFGETVSIRDVQLMVAFEKKNRFVAANVWFEK